MLIRIVMGMAIAVLLCSAGLAQTESREPAIATTFSDPNLKWGPCPGFIPKGCEIAVLHGDPSRQNADILFKVPANFNVPRHTHTSAERMILLSGVLHVTYDGQKTAVLKQGMYAYGPAGRPHTAFCAKGSPCILFIAFESAVDAFPTTGKPGN